ncbi:MAG: hypothetical protein PF508_00865 [Spirochaeta sp.]|jgi:hypothetical protein|nr:hypothetical protein [Spirochaeta sp.]
MNDEHFQDLDRLFSQLREAPPNSQAELDRIYRRGSRALHPDLTGDDGSRFVRFQHVFALYRTEWADRRSISSIRQSVDPFAVLRDLGLPDDLPPRPALYASLYRFRSLGLERWRVRTRPALRRRNAQIIRTVIYWAYAYNRTAPRVLTPFLLHPGSFAVQDRHASRYFLLRKLLFRSLDLLIRYQDLQREATRDIARDILAYVDHVFPDQRRDAPPVFGELREMMRWISAESELPPDRIGLDG